MDVKRSIRRDVKTTVTLDEAEYKSILRQAVDAPPEAEVDIEGGYGRDIMISWTKTAYDEEGGDA